MLAIALAGVTVVGVLLFNSDVQLEELKRLPSPDERVDVIISRWTCGHREHELSSRSRRQPERSLGWLQKAGYSVRRRSNL